MDLDTDVVLDIHMESDTTMKFDNDPFTNAVSYALVIADLRIEIKITHPLEINENFLPFIDRESGHADCRALIVEKLVEEPRFEENPFEENPSVESPTDEKSLQNILQGKLQGSDFDMDCYQTEEGVYRAFHKTTGSQVYAIQKEEKPGKLSRVLLVEPDMVQNMNQCFRLIGWEQMLIHHNRLILHASCIKTSYGGILFSGPSGIGKSTQADLWWQYRGAELINGDKTILYKKTLDSMSTNLLNKEYPSSRAIWHGYGSPFAGSSRCYRNESVPLCCIVFLEQGETNEIRRLSGGEAFRRVYEQLTIYTWDREFVDRAVNLCMDLITTLPIYLLSCRPDEGAVRTLEDRITLGGAQ